MLRFASEHRAVVVGVWRKGGNHGLPVNAELDFDARNSTLGRVAATAGPRASTATPAPRELPRLMEAIEIRASVATPIHSTVGSGARSSRRTRATSRSPAAPRSASSRSRSSWARRSRTPQARRRMAESADESRRRLERGLHAGARQHLLALKLKLRLARDRARTGDDVVALLDDALAEAVGRRRLPARAGPGRPSGRPDGARPGRRPAGPGRQGGMRVLLRALPGRRFAPPSRPPPTRSSPRALANVAAHAHATTATVALADHGDRLVVEVADDGIGGADPSGAGLRALADRVAAVGGHLAIASPPGDRTVIRAELPITRCTRSGHPTVLAGATRTAGPRDACLPSIGRRGDR